jgi:hypothetical protein
LIKERNVDIAYQVLDMLAAGTSPGRPKKSADCAVSLRFLWAHREYLFFLLICSAIQTDPLAHHYSAMSCGSARHDNASLSKVKATKREIISKCAEFATLCRAVSLE